MIKIPNEPHYAIIEHTSHYVEGDQRSRDVPGHGYPSRWEEGIKYNVFLNEDELLKWIHLWGKNQNYSVIKAIPMKVETTMSVKVK